MAKTLPSQSSVLHSTDPLSVNAIRLRYGHILGYEDLMRLSLDAKSSHKVESKYKRMFREAIFEAASRALDDLAAGKELDHDHFDFEPLIRAHAIESMKSAMRKPKPTPTTRMAAKKKGTSQGLQSIFEMWDEWRAGKISKRQKKDAADLKESFLFGVKEFWKKNSRDFRMGDAYNMGDVKEAFVKSAKIPVARANMIVQTETTHYYNKALTKIYKGAEGVTHYLYVAIRDRRTTKWCTDHRQHGRDGLVYPKESVLTDRNTPPCHWNCRSQFLPLSPSNPKHAKLIDDKSRLAVNNKPVPLPRGWNNG